MKFTQLPKKLLLTGMSAAMVVAFAPAVAQAKVSETAGQDGTAPSADKSYEVAEVSWKNAKTPQVYKSDETATDDDALQAALSFAATKSKKSDDVTVTLMKSVTVGDVNEDSANEGLTDEDGLIASGKVTIDLNGNTIDNGWSTEKTKNTQVLTVEGQSYVVTKANKNRVSSTKGTTVYYGVESGTKDISVDTLAATADKAGIDAAKSEAETNAETAKSELETAKQAYDKAKSDKKTADKAYEEAQDATAAAYEAKDETEADEKASDKAKADARKAYYDAVAAETKAETEAENAQTAFENASAAVDKAQTTYKKAQAATEEETYTKAANEAAQKAALDELVDSGILSELLGEDGSEYKGSKEYEDAEAAGLKGVKIEQTNAGVPYFKTTGNKFSTTANENSKTTQKADAKQYTQYKITLTYKDAVEKDVVEETDGDVTVVGGDVTSNTDKSAIVVRDASLTLGEKAAVTTSKAGIAVRGNEGSTVSLVDGTTVSAYVDDAADNNNDSYAGVAGDKKSVTAVRAGDVVIGHSGKEDDHAYTNTQATVTATLDNGQNGRTAKGIVSYDDVTAYETADVTAKATPKDETHADITNRITGIIDHNDDAEANTVFSAAVIAKDKANLHYGNYAGDFAVIAGYKVESNKYVIDGKNAGFIMDGTYDGYVWNAANTVITGGKFKYDPTKEFESKVGGKSFQVQNATKLGLVSDGFGHGKYEAATNSANGYTYVYRIGYAELAYAMVNGEHSSSDYMEIAVPEDATDAAGKSYVKTYDDPLTAYVQDKYLDAFTQQLVFSEQGTGRELNDGNTFTKQYGVPQPTVNVKITGRYVTPTTDASKEAGYEAAYNTLKAQADADMQTPQGVYVLSAQPEYGFQKAAKGDRADANGFKIVNGEQVAANYGDALTSLGDAKLAVKASLVTSYADAKAYKLGDKAEAIDLTLPAAVGSTIYGYGTFTTADMGSYGINVTTTSDAVKQAQAKADAAKAEADAKAKAAEQAAADAKAAAEKEAAEAQAKAEAAQKAADEAKAQLAQQKAEAKAKAKKVKGLKVKVGKKKATVSWKKVKGAVKYQVKYRQKNSSKTADFKYKTVKKNKYTAKKLKTGKYYNFKVRVYTKAGSKTVAGKWTSIVTGKIK